MGSKIGRPKATMPKNIDLKVRVDESTYNRIILYTQRHNITKAEAFRRGIELLLESEKERE